MEPQLFRQLNALVRSDSQKTKILHALQNNTALDPRHDGFHLQGSRVMYMLQTGEKLELLMSPEVVADTLREEYARSGIGKGQTAFYKHVQARYLGVTRAAITTFLKAQAGACRKKGRYGW
jgi:hypothetical protein